MDTSNLNTNQNPMKTDSEDLTAGYDLESMDPEQRQKVEEELKNELAKVRLDNNNNNNGKKEET